MSDEPETIWAKAGMPGYACECKPRVYDVEYIRADRVRVTGFEDTPQWLPIDGDTPYETRVLTYWPGDGRRNPLHLINTRNNGETMGDKDGWWYSRPDQMPTHWKHLDKPTE